MHEPEPSFLTDWGSWKDRITISEKLWVGGGSDTPDIDEDDKEKTFGQV